MANLSTHRQQITTLRKPTWHIGFHKPLLLAFFSLIFLSTFLPAGSVFGVNVKVLSYLLTIISFAPYLLLQKARFSRRDLLLFSAFLASISFFFLWAIIAYINGGDLGTTISALQAFVVTSSIVYIAYFLYLEKLFSFVYFTKVVIVASLIYSLLKVLIVSLLFFYLISFEQVLDLFTTVLNYDFVSMLIAPNLVRMQLINDILIPFLILFVLLGKRIGLRLPLWFSSAFLIVSFLSIFLAYSRFIFLLTAALIVIYITLLAFQRISSIIMVILAIFALTASSAYFVSDIAYFVERRFFSAEVVSSDDIRTAQYEALIRESESYPLLGKGIGGYVEDYIRSESLRYTYELQWLSFMLQFGLVGLVFLAAHLVAVVAPLLSQSLTPLKSVILATYLLWLSSGFSNPYMISSTSGVLFSLFLLCSLALKKKQGKLTTRI